jgi:hypothetical protein
MQYYKSLLILVLQNFDMASHENDWSLSFSVYKSCDERKLVLLTLYLCLVT